MPLPLIPAIGAALVASLNVALHAAGIHYTVSFAAVTAPVTVLTGILTAAGIAVPAGVTITGFQAVNALTQIPVQLAKQNNAQLAIKAALRAAGVPIR